MYIPREKLAEVSIDKHCVLFLLISQPETIMVHALDNYFSAFEHLVNCSFVVIFLKERRSFS